MQSPVLISILSGLCGRALLGFPALAGQEYGAWNHVLATGVVSHLTPGEPAVPGIDDSATLANTSLWYHI
jgi:hypothetical protein